MGVSESPWSPRGNRTGINVENGRKFFTEPFTNKFIFYGGKKQGVETTHETV